MIEILMIIAILFLSAARIAAHVGRDALAVSTALCGYGLVAGTAAHFFADPNTGIIQLSTGWIIIGVFFVASVITGAFFIMKRLDQPLSSYEARNGGPL